MILHNSRYEAEGWINVNKELPDFDIKVEVIRVHILDWNLEQLEWESIGKYRDLGVRKIWSVKYSKGINMSNATPTHWKPLDFERNKVEEILKWLEEND